MLFFQVADFGEAVYRFHDPCSVGWFTSAGAEQAHQDQYRDKIGQRDDEAVTQHGKGGAHW